MPTPMGQNYSDALLLRFDADRNKQIDMEEFKAMVGEQCPGAMPREVELIFYLLDRNCNHSLSFKECKPIVEGLKTSADIYELMAVAADLNGDGKIGSAEMAIVHKFYSRSIMPEEAATYKAGLSRQEFIRVVKDMM